jgi:tellurite resistance protein
MSRGGNNPLRQKERKRKMAILPTKNELKEVSLDTLTAYYEMLGEEMARRKTEVKRRQREEVIELLNQAFDLATEYNIRINVVDSNAEIDIDVNDGEIYGGADYNTIAIDLYR